MDKPRPSAAEVTRGRRIRLHERLEQVLQRAGRDADARVPHFETRSRRLPSPSSTLLTSMTISPSRVNLMALLIEVDQTLPNALRIADDAIRHVRMDVHDELQILRGGLERQHHRDVFHGVAQVQLERFDVELAGFDLGEIQDVVDDDQQRVGARANGFRVIALRAVERAFQQQAGHADDAVHRRANLVTDVGEEFALGAVGALGGFGRA